MKRSTVSFLTLAHTRVVASCLAAALFATPAFALQTIYVSPCGDDSAGGGSANCATVPLFKPKRTIQAAINAAVFSGDVIVVMPGTYNESINLLGRPITVKSDGGPGVTTISGAGLNSSVVRCVSGETAATVLQGFTIRGGLGSIHSGGSFGGGIQIVGSSPTIRDCVFTENNASDGGGAGCASGNPRFVRCTFKNNHSGAFGGGLIFEGSQGQLINCILDDNQANSHGGGVMLESNANVSMLNCVLSWNGSGSSGGGVMCGGTSVARILGCTFYNNTASAGPAIHVALSTGSLVSNSILWGTAPSQVFSLVPVFSYCDVRGGAPGVGNIDVDPKFVSAASGNYRLQSSSPCIDAGDSASPPAAVDLDSNPRFTDAPASPDTGFMLAGPIIDMGAYEFQLLSPPACSADLNHDHLVNGLDLGSMLAAWGACP